MQLTNKLTNLRSYKILKANQVNDSQAVLNARNDFRTSIYCFERSLIRKFGVLGIYLIRYRKISLGKVLDFRKLCVAFTNYRANGLKKKIKKIGRFLCIISLLWIRLEFKTTSILNSNKRLRNSVNRVLLRVMMQQI